MDKTSNIHGTCLYLLPTLHDKAHLQNRIDLCLRDDFRRYKVVKATIEPALPCVYVPEYVLKMVLGLDVHLLFIVELQH